MQNAQMQDRFIDFVSRLDHAIDIDSLLHSVTNGRLVSYQSGL
jgi:hypothetical protein